MRMSLSEQLRESPLFRGVEMADLEALVSRMQPLSYVRDAVLFEKDSTGDSLYIILSGRIRIYSTDRQGNEFTIRHYGPNQIVGEFSLLDQKPRSATAAAVEPTEVLVLQRSDFLSFLNERPLVGLSMMRTLVDRVRYTTTYLQKVLEAIQGLPQGDYDRAAEVVPADVADSEIEILIAAFWRMVDDVQAREERLRRMTEGDQDDSLDTDGESWDGGVEKQP
jgi:CRP-like cAMP-binding protein